MLRKVKDDVQNSNIKPDNFGDRVIFMSMFNDIHWNKKNNEGACISNSEEIRDFAKRFSQGHWTVLDQDMWRNCMKIVFASPEEDGIPQQHTCYNDLRRQIMQFLQVSLQ